jgi:hypothetical protein
MLVSIKYIWFNPRILHTLKILIPPYIRHPTKYFRQRRTPQSRGENGTMFGFQTPAMRRCSFAQTFNKGIVQIA